MEYRIFGKTNEKVSVIGMGTYYDISWIILSHLGIKRKYRKKVEAIREGIEGGINFIDTAEIYNSEELIAKAIEGYKRENLFIASKVWPSHLKYDDVIKACKRSLRRLNTKYIDLYQIHFPSRRIPIKETMKAMEDLVDMGLIRYIGLSNFNLQQMIEAQEAMKKYEIVSNQMPFSMANRKIEKDIIPYSIKNKIAIICYYPLGHGELIKRIPKEIVEKVKEKYGEKTPAQIALNWIISKYENTFPIPRASNPVHVKENLNAIGWKMDDEILNIVDKYFPLD